MAEAVCRCGWDGTGEHPCHFAAYTCRKPAKRRYYNARPVALAGVQMKLQATETWACDECWAEFKKMMEGQRGADEAATATDRTGR